MSSIIRSSESEAEASLSDVVRSRISSFALPFEREEGGRVEEEEEVGWESFVGRVEARCGPPAPVLPTPTPLAAD